MSEEMRETPKFKEFFVKQSGEKILDDAAEIATKLVKSAGSLTRAKNWRNFNWDNAKITNHGRIQGGSGDFKHIATVPKDLALACDWFEDGSFWVDEKKFEAWLRRNPQYRSYTPER